MLKVMEMLGQGIDVEEILARIWKISGNEGYKTIPSPRNALTYAGGFWVSMILRNRPHILKMYWSISMKCPRNPEATKARCSLIEASFEAAVKVKLGVLGDRSTGPRCTLNPKP